MKNFSLLVARFSLLVFILSSSVFALDTSLTSLSNNMVLGYITSGSTQTATVAIRPDLKWGPWNLGLDVNIPLTQSQTPPNYDAIVLRYAEYNDGQKGLKYGAVENITWGRGLLMKNYSSRAAGPIVLTNKQVALTGFYSADRVKFQFLDTWSHIYALRLTEKIHPMVTLGQSVITDADGVLVVQTDASQKQYPSVTGMSADLAVPLPLNAEGYAEIAQMINHGGGLAYGLNWGFDALVFAASFDLSYRTFDKQFVPGYFNANYETNPIDFASYEASGANKNGTVAQLNVLAGEVFKLGLVYENYSNTKPSFNGEASIGLSNVNISVFYSQPDFTDFRSLDFQQGAILREVISYKLNPNMALVLNYKKFYDGTIGSVVESNYYEVKFSL